ncbi:MAG: J domain-containing protein [Granulosicoccus sp.]
MISEDSQKNQFAKHYELLEIDDRASWDIARSSYRRLVHIWHPDKFTSRPREKVFAQQQFINLTKSYNELRDFHRTNHRLPFQSDHVASKLDAPPLIADIPLHSAASDTTVVNANVLSRDPSERNHSQRRLRTMYKTAWLMTGVFTLLTTVMFFIILDRKQNQATAAIGREVVRDAPESEFMPNASEIRRSQTRGAFVKPTK